VGCKLEEVLERPEMLEVLRELATQARPGVRESVRQQVVVPSGEEVLTLVVTLSLLQDDEGRGLGSVIVFDDYTQEVRAQRMAAWREVARRIAHEIKNPLTPIQLAAQRIRGASATASRMRRRTRRSSTSASTRSRATSTGSRCW
jgi:two-component system nitrogen regulation sensor histidine kinase NtrY